MNASKSSSADVWKRVVCSRGFATEGVLMGQLIHVDVVCFWCHKLQLDLAWTSLGSPVRLGVDLTRLLIPVPTNVDLGSAGMACQQGSEGQRPDSK